MILVVTHQGRCVYNSLFNPFLGVESNLSCFFFSIIILLLFSLCSTNSGLFFLSLVFHCWPFSCFFYSFVYNTFLLFRYLYDDDDDVKFIQFLRCDFNSFHSSFVLSFLSSFARFVKDINNIFFAF